MKWVNWIIGIVTVALWLIVLLWRTPKREITQEDES